MGAAGAGQAGFNQQICSPNFNPILMYNIYLNNQMAMNYRMIYYNMLMNCMQKMNQLFMMNNGQNDHNNYNNFGVQGGANPQQFQKTILPKNVQATLDPFPNNNFMKLNIIFDSYGNFRVNILTPINTKLKDLFKTFIRTVGLEEKVLGTYIYFLFNGLTIPIKSEQTIYDFGIRKDYTSIIVMDTSNLLGG